MPFESPRRPPGGPGLDGGPALPGRRAWLRRALCLSAGALGLPQAGFAGGLKRGAPAPPLVLHGVDGTAIATDALRGKVVILCFWATWCGPCREELPALSAYAAEHAKDGLQVLGFSLDEPDAMPEVKRVGAGLSFPVGLLGSEYAGGYGRIWRLPANFTIDRQGRLADNSWDDAQPQWTEARLRRIVAPLLAQPP
jgi:peroxiredoxin